MLQIIIIVVSILFALGVACAMSYIIGITKGFGDCYKILNDKDRLNDEQIQIENYDEDSSSKR